MKKIIKIQQPQTAPLMLTWVINNICTNQCSYCPSILHAGKNHHYDWDNARSFFKLLFDRYPKIHCAVSGGEPSVSPFLPEIAKIFYDAGHSIGITSNAAKSVDYWTTISPYLHYICFSYHAEFPEAKFMDKINAAAKNTFVTARIMMHPDKWDQCVNLYNTLINANQVFVEPVRMLDWNGANRAAHIYDHQQIEWFKTHQGNHSTLTLHHLANRPMVEMGAEFTFSDGTKDNTANAVDYINAGMTNFNNYTCSAGLNSLFINFQGDVYLANCCIHGSIGNINDPHNIKWPQEHVVCNKNLCHCSTDVNLTKWAP